ncbi:hypothetical protein UQ36_28215, partial [Escherichia coli]|uniref:DNA gyrase C-terminal beta-propeller domain-containing protein n=1 Tax=Escherichia coli TaxID=562 RepID=UPI000B69F4E2
GGRPQRQVWIRDSTRGARGPPIVQLLPLEQDERITAILPVTEFEEGVKVFMATANGTVKKTVLTEFNRLRTAGKVAIKLVEGDELIGVDLTSGEDEVMLFSAEGKVVRFKESSVRAMGCNTTGVRGIRLGEGDKVVSLIVPRGDGAILTATQLTLIPIYLSEKKKPHNNSNLIFCLKNKTKHRARQQSTTETTK